MKLQNDIALWLFWLLPFAFGLYMLYFRRKRILLSRFVQAKLLDKMALDVSRPRQILKAILLILAATAIIFALTQPVWNKKPRDVQHKGRDLAVILDVSRSMLAEDLKPNRLERAKLDLKELLGALNGDRLGIVVFSGNAVVKCPLTLDYGFARMAIDSISTESVTKGGTNIGDAIRETLTNVFDDQEGYKDIILITDGEDHDSEPVKAAQLAAGKNIRLFVIGIGDPIEGARIPITDEFGRQTYLKYEDKIVKTKLDIKLLEDIATATPGGKFLNVSTGNYDMTDFYNSLIAPASQRNFDQTTVFDYEQKFQIFLIIAIALAAIEPLISERRKNVSK
ncbi:MAG: VWA domain-containing protein [Phycisphaerae bacterium]|nr:VWA domain-containing protein [Phycisphaerae bacterium]